MRNFGVWKIDREGLGEEREREEFISVGVYFLRLIVKIMIMKNVRVVFWYE